MATYSFIDNQASITGPGGSFSLSYGSGNSEEGITTSFVEDKNVMTVGADGTVMHSHHAGRGGTYTLHYLKTSPTNAQLNLLYNTQTLSSTLHGKNIITIRDNSSGDVITGAFCAFKKHPDINYAKDGGMQAWVFDVGTHTVLLGSQNQN